GVYLPRSNGIRAAMLDIERAEVLKGPQGTLYGKNSTGGAISITTKQPELNASSGYVTLNYGNYGIRDITGAVNVALIEDVAAMRLVGKSAKQDGFGSTPQRRDVGSEDNDAFRLHLLVEPTENLTIRLSGD